MRHAARLLRILWATLATAGVAHSAMIVPLQPNATLTPDTTHTLPFRLSNPTTTAITRTPVAHLPEGWSSLFAPTAVTLAPGEQTSWLLTFTTPQNTAAGTYPINVRFEEAADPHATVTVTVPSRHDLILEPLEAPSLVLGEPYEATFRATNTGNTPQALHFEANANTATASPEPTRVRLSPGDSAVVSVRVTPHPRDALQRIRTRLIATSSTLAVTATSTTEAAPPVGHEPDLLHRERFTITYEYDGHHIGSNGRPEATLNLHGHGRFTDTSRTRFDLSATHSITHDRQTFELQLSRDAIQGTIGHHTPNFMASRTTEKPFGVTFRWEPAPGTHITTGIARTQPQQPFTGLTFKHRAPRAHVEGRLAYSLDHGIESDTRMTLGVDDPIEAGVRVRTNDERHRLTTHATTHLLGNELTLTSRFDHRTYHDPNRRSRTTLDTTATLEHEYEDVPYVVTVDHHANFSTRAQSWELRYDETSTPQRLRARLRRTTRPNILARTTAHLALARDDVPAPLQSLNASTTWHWMGRDLARITTYASTRLTWGDHRLTSLLYGRYDPGQNQWGDLRARLSWAPPTFHSWDTTLSLQAETRPAPNVTLDTHISTFLTNDIQLDARLTPRYHANNGLTFDASLRATIPLDVPLAPLQNIQTVSGHVLGDNDEPLPDVHVRLAGFLAITDEDGAFRFPAIPHGEHYLTLDPPDELGKRLATPTTPLQLAVGATPSAPVAIQLRTPVTIEGSLAPNPHPADTPINLWLPDITPGIGGGIRLHAQQDNLTYTTTTRSDGSFSFKNLPDGTWRIMIEESTLPEHWAITPPNDPLHLSPGDTSTLDLPLKPIPRRLNFQDGGTL